MFNASISFSPLSITSYIISHYLHRANKTN
nr:MAG TPA: hypothetical protein [Caudoviricetes sp.]